MARREPTPEEEARLDRRWREYEGFLHSIRPGIEQFIRLIMVEPEPYLGDLEKFLPVLDDWLRNQDLSDCSEDDLRWLRVRIGYVVGEILLKRFGAIWKICDDPGSTFFCRYVLGYFQQGVKEGLILDPFEVSGDCLQTLPPRSLLAVIEETIEELKPKASRGR